MIVKLLIVLFFLGVSPLINGEEIELTFQENRTVRMNFSVMPAVKSNRVWTNGADFFSDKAKTYTFTQPYSSARRSILACVDPISKKKNVFYLDLNNNKTIDKGEAFHAEPFDIDAAGLHDFADAAYKVTKIPYKGNMDINITYFEKYKFGDLDGILFSASAWGCYKGEAILNGAPYNVTLIDNNLDGQFNNYQTSGQYDADQLNIRPKDAAPAKVNVANDPLRRKMLINAKAYEVIIKENGKKLILDPISVEMGEVISNMQTFLAHEDWGNMILQANQKKSLPAGEWALTHYQNSHKNGFIGVTYIGDGKINIDVAPNKVKELKLDTRLIAAISSNRRAKYVDLNLKLKTSQGASFASYYNSTKKFEGIPFTITDGSGKTVHQGKFTFG